MVLSDIEIANSVQMKPIKRWQKAQELLRTLVSLWKLQGKISAEPTGSQRQAQTAN